MSQIFIYRDGQNQGPYNLEQVQACLIVGTLTATDFAWCEGLANWISLSALVAQLEQQGRSASDGWRRKVATADQKADLRCLGLKAKRDLTQGGYQDLINEAWKDAANKSKLEVFRLKRSKEREFSDFLQKNFFRLGMTPPTMAQLRETIDFLHDSIPNWASETSPKEFAILILTRYPNLKTQWYPTPTTGAEDFPNWGDEPATERQLNYLRDLGAHSSPDISKAEASEIIERIKNQASDAQKRRLIFYGLNFDPHITKEEAASLIDCYRERYPESEDAYQEWKIRNHIT
jgi:hypothetical protein